MGTAATDGGTLREVAESIPSAALRRLFLKLSFSPRFRATTQHKRSRNAVFAQDKRRTGARYFVRSGTDENDIAIARNLIMPRR